MYFPEPHDMHEDCPELGWYSPISHFWQVLVSSLYVPSLHLMHSEGTEGLQLIQSCPVQSLQIPSELPYL